jgi:hypothetical protein
MASVVSARNRPSDERSVKGYNRKRSASFTAMHNRRPGTRRVRRCNIDRDLMRGTPHASAER